MKKSKIEFTGSDGDKLSGLLEQPNGQTLAYALFAHCFTCGKDIASASRVARALVARGYAVLRFDFTGLGGSDGDFANTNFSSNVEDLVRAAAYLRDNWHAPRLLVGHSLGGTAILKAAAVIPEALGVVTIGSPADASHVSKQFSCDIDIIEQKGEAEVSLAGRQFTIKKQFLDDIQSQAMEHLPNLNKALLVMHSPVDSTVSINEAEKIYRAAKHPKSFISLDDADHLLTRKPDAEYVAETIAAWAGRFIAPVDLISEGDAGLPSGEVIVEERNSTFTQNVSTDSHFWLADEPASVGGSNLGPDPYEHLLAALGTCTSMTLRMYANHKKWPLKQVKVQMRHYRQHGEDCQHCDDQNSKVDVIDREITLSGELEKDQRERLLEIADRCPVHKTLHGKIVVNSTLT
jgi:putative redox protein